MCACACVRTCIDGSVIIPKFFSIIINKLEDKPRLPVGPVAMFAKCVILAQILSLQQRWQIS